MPWIPANGLRSHRYPFFGADDAVVAPAPQEAAVKTMKRGLLVAAGIVGLQAYATYKAAQGKSGKWPFYALAGITAWNLVGLIRTKAVLDTMQAFSNT